MITTSKRFFSEMFSKETATFVGVFFIILATAKFGQYLFFEWKTSPAILWPPTGIGLAVLYLGGYRYIIPIFFGLIGASLTGPTAHLVPAVITTPIGQVLGQLAGAYLLRRFKYDASWPNVRNVLVFLGVIIASSAVAPTITTLIGMTMGTLSTNPYVSWSRSWAGYVFSCLILVPLILSWTRPDHRIAERGRYEAVFLAVSILLSVYFLFWTRVASQFSFLSFAPFFVVLVWACLRFSTRGVTLSFFAVTVFGILGLFVSPNPERTLNSQLFATELFLFLVVPIFHLFSALVKERANTIAELKEAMGRIEKENVLKNEFIAVLAHELRNPLAPVKTTLEILEIQKSDPETKRLITSAHKQVHMMRRLLDDLLDITRITQKRFQLQFERANVHAMLERAIDSTRHLVEERRHTIVVDPASDKGIWVNVDPVRFEQVLVNVINNAAKYTEPGGTISLGYAADGKRMELWIRDNGIGIEEGHIKDVFKPFWQWGNAVPRMSGSIGIGLSLSKHIIEMHGGGMRAESDGPGKGSMFTIDLPLPSPGDQLPTYAKSRSTGPVPAFKILVVDDNAAAADSLTKLLSLKGHQVRTTYTGTEVFDVAEEFRPEIVLLDIGLPDISGYEVAQHLRAKGFKEKIIALSGYGQKEEKQKALDSGFDHHITKPMAIHHFEEYLLALKKV